MSEVGWRVVSGLGFFVLLGLAWLVSTDRAAVSKRTIARGVAAQVALAVALLATPLRDVVFPLFEGLVAGLSAWSGEGARFLFGPLYDGGYSFALHALPIIIFLGSVMGVAYHLGLVQPLVRGFARLLSRSLGVSGAESLAAVANGDAVGYVTQLRSVGLGDIEMRNVGAVISPRFYCPRQRAFPAGNRVQHTVS